MRRSDRIYPVPVKPRTNINRWRDWPEDCVQAIKRLVRGWYSTGGVFKCSDCSEFCQPHPHGVPHLGSARDGRDCTTILCDDCLIARARAA